MRARTAGWSAAPAAAHPSTARNALRLQPRGFGRSYRSAPRLAANQAAGAHGAGPIGSRPLPSARAWPWAPFPPPQTDAPPTMWTWLLLSRQNAIRSMRPLESLTQLRFVVLSHNKINKVGRHPSRAVGSDLRLFYAPFPRASCPWPPHGRCTPDRGRGRLGAAPGPRPLTQRHRRPGRRRVPPSHTAPAARCGRVLTASDVADALPHSLAMLLLHSNPCSRHPFYRQRVVTALPRLKARWAHLGESDYAPPGNAPTVPLPPGAAAGRDPCHGAGARDAGPSPQ